MTVPLTAHYMKHVSEYGSFEQFERAVVDFLKNERLNELLNDSFNFSCGNDYQPDLQKIQTAAMNKILNKIYGSKVEWKFKAFENEDTIWGPVLLINGKEHLLFQNLDLSIDSFIKTLLNIS